MSDYYRITEYVLENMIKDDINKVVSDTNDSIIDTKNDTIGYISQQKTSMHESFSDTDTNGILYKTGTANADANSYYLNTVGLVEDTEAVISTNVMQSIEDNGYNIALTVDSNGNATVTIAR